MPFYKKGVAVLLLSAGLVIGSVSLASGDSHSQPHGGQSTKYLLTADQSRVKLRRHTGCNLATFKAQAKAVYRADHKVTARGTGRLARIRGCSAKPLRSTEDRLWRETARRHRERMADRLPSDYSAWSRVAGCETGGWQVIGAAFPDPLGITRQNYIDFGGTPLPPGQVPVSERASVIRVADRLAAAYGTGIPDQDGCGSW